ncbi:MAG: hypothetical protein WA948_12810 [Pontixanthobacter sp.]
MRGQADKRMRASNAERTPDARRNQSRGRRILKGVLLATGGIALAAVGGAQAASNVFAMTAPERAIGLSPLSSQAPTRLARTLFAAVPGGTLQTDRADTGALGAAYDLARQFARTAILRDPLAIDAATIYAAGLPTAERRDALIAASALNKRTRLLNGLLLQQYQQMGDPEGVLTVLDHTLRVRPSLRSQILPVMVALLNTRDAVPYFAEVLSDGPSWTNSFLVAAARDRTVARNLGALRIALDAADDRGAGESQTEPITLATDRAIIESLIRNGILEEAAAVYRIASSDHNAAPRTGAAGADPYTIDWTNALPPLEWQFADDRGFYARTRMDETDLKISIRPGFGGVLAERFILLPNDATGIRLTHTIEPAEQRQNLNLKLTCATGGGPLIDTEFQSSPMELTWTRDTPCPIAQITVEGRAFSTDIRTSGTIAPITITR